LTLRGPLKNLFFNKGILRNWILAQSRFPAYLLKGDLFITQRV